MIKVTIEFSSLEEAVVNLGKIADLAPPTTASIKRTRKPRSDAGKERGTLVKPEAPVSGDPAEPVAEAGAADTGKVVKPAASQKSTTPPAPVLPAGSPPVNSTVETHFGPFKTDDAQGAMQLLFNTKGMDTAKEALSRFGVGRVRDMKPEQHLDFVMHVVETLGGADKANEAMTAWLKKAGA